MAKRQKRPKPSLRRQRPPVKPPRRRFLSRLAGVGGGLLSLPFAPLLKAAAGRPAHHLADGRFRNSDGTLIDNSFADLLRWRREAPEISPVTFPLAEKQTALLRDNREKPTLTWIGHASFLLQLSGINLITDPHFSDRASPLPFTGPKRTTPPGLKVDELPAIDGVLISHNHYDHLDHASIAVLAHRRPQTRFFVPLKLADTLTKMGAKNIEEFDWGESRPLADGVRLTAEACHHWSARSPFDRNRTLWASWVIETPSLRLLFIGDTGYSTDFSALAEKYGAFDAAIIPIGAYRPRWFMKTAHINPEESVRIFGDLNTRFAVASHWGTFILTDEPMDEPPRALAEALTAAAIPEDRFALFRHGETRDLSFLQRQPT